MELQHHDPARLEPSECHVRRSRAGPSEEFVRNVSEVGIVVPLQGRYEDGGLRLIDGVRRALAAAEAGIETVPVLVREIDDAEATAASVALNDAQAGGRKSVSDLDREQAVSRAADMRDTETDSERVRLGIMNERDRIEQAVGGAFGVGDSVIGALADAFEDREAVEQASYRELTNVDGVGEKTALSIRQWLDRPEGVLIPVDGS